MRMMPHSLRTPPDPGPHLLQERRVCGVQHQGVDGDLGSLQMTGMGAGKDQGRLKQAIGNLYSFNLVSDTSETPQMPGTLIDTRPLTCAEKIAFMIGMYCMGTSGEPMRQRMRGRELSAGRVRLGALFSRWMRHSAHDRAAESATDELELVPPA